MDHGNIDFFDPLRGLADNASVSEEDLQDLESTFSEASTQLPMKEWMSFKRFLMQRFPVSKMVSISSVSIQSFSLEISTCQLILTSHNFCWRPRVYEIGFEPCVFVFWQSGLCLGYQFNFVQILLLMAYPVIIGFLDKCYFIYYWSIQVSEQWYYCLSWLCIII